MKAKRLREDKICLACGERVLDRYCGRCGQENTDTRMPFGELIKHFVFDFLHYDKAFLKTIKILFVKPGHLTSIYLKGDRKTYFPPVKLYIFVSFIVFFVLFSFSQQDQQRIYQYNINEVRDKHRIIELNIFDRTLALPHRYISIEQLDSTESTLPKNLRKSYFDYALAKKTIEMQKYDEHELGEKFFLTLEHNIPKTIFIYLPLFATVLWLFNSKSKWLLFDHSIFTLHYFSFALAAFLIFPICKILFFVNEDLLVFSEICGIALYFWSLVRYFYKAYRYVYGGSKIAGLLQTTVVISLNLIIFTGVFFLLAIYSLFNLH